MDLCWQQMDFFVQNMAHGDDSSSAVSHLGLRKSMSNQQRTNGPEVLLSTSDRSLQPIKLSSHTPCRENTCTWASWPRRLLFSHWWVKGTIVPPLPCHWRKTIQLWQWATCRGPSLDASLIDLAAHEKRSDRFPGWARSDAVKVFSWNPINTCMLTLFW